MVIILVVIPLRRTQTSSWYNIYNICTLDSQRVTSISITNKHTGYTRWLTVVGKLLLFVVPQLRPAGRTPEAQYPPPGQLSLNTLPPHNQHEEDQNPVKAVDRIYDQPEPRPVHVALLDVERDNFENPDQPSQQE